MILDEHHRNAFRTYEKPLKKLEISFNSAGLPVTFHAFADPFGNKMVRVTGGSSSQKLICIEGDSPAQAVKDVAKGVRL